MFAVNLDSVFHLFQIAARHMMDRAASGDAFGRLVATSSSASLFGTARNEHYAATKAAMNALVRALAVELARYGITANAILPGWIRCEMTAEIMTNEKFVSNVMPTVSDGALRRARRFWWNSGLLNQQGFILSHGGMLCGGWRLIPLFDFPSAVRVCRAIGVDDASSFRSALPASFPNSRP